MAHPTLHEFRDTPVTLKIPAKFAHLAPKLIERQCEFQLRGINNSIAAAIIRTIGGELPVRFLDCEFEDIECDDEYLNPEQLIMRMRMIPIMQSLKVGAKFSLTYHNKSPIIHPVKTSELKGQFDGTPFNPNITVWGISRSKTLKLQCRVAESYQYIENYGGLSVAVQCVALPIDETPFTVHSKTGTPNAVANPRDFQFRFFTHGTMAPKAILMAGFDSLIARIQRVAEFIPIKLVEGDVHIYKIIGDSATIGILLEKALVENFPINSVAFDIDTEVVVLRLFMDNGDADETMYKVIDMLTTEFQLIKKLF